MSQAVGSKYTREEALGQGASGTVWRGRVRGSSEEVAVKVLHEGLASDPDVVVRFLQERSLLERVKHPNLVGVRDLVVEGALLALVMELIDGPDLRTYLRGRGTLRPGEAAHLIAEIAAALATIHHNGIIHRDLKPANILMWVTDTGLKPMLTDFGIARLADGPQLTRTNEVLGTPFYLAPETIMGETPGVAADVYSLGVVLYELLAGAPPFKSDDSFLVLRRHVQDEPRRPPDVPDRLWGVVAQCMVKEPAGRPGARAMAEELRAFVERNGGDTGEIASVEGTPIRPQRPAPEPDPGNWGGGAAETKDARNAAFPGQGTPASNNPRSNPAMTQTTTAVNFDGSTRTNKAPPPDATQAAPADYESIRKQLDTSRAAEIEEFDKPKRERRQREKKAKQKQKDQRRRMPLWFRFLAFFWRLTPKTCLFRLALLVAVGVATYNYLRSSQYQWVVNNPIVDNTVEQVRTTINRVIRRNQLGG